MPCPRPGAPFTRTLSSTISRSSGLVSNASAAIYNATMSQGYAKADTAAVCAVLEAMAGIRR